MLGFIQGTMITMEDASRKPVEEIALGDRIMLGGQVQGICVRVSKDVVLYNNVGVDASTPIFTELSAGYKWLRARDTNGKKMDVGQGILVYGLISQGGVAISGEVVFSDMNELPNRHRFNDMQAIDEMNNDKDRTRKLREIIQEFQSQRLRKKALGE